MFEITVSSSKTKRKDISFIVKAIKPKLKQIRAVMVSECCGERENLAIATEEYNKELVLSWLFDAISETIIRNYKEEIFIEKLKSKINDSVALNSFVKALTMFDKSSDKDLIKSALKPCEVINIDSLYLFNLWELQKRWESVAVLICENVNSLLISGAFNELMKFLIITNEVEFGDVYLSLNNNEIFAKSVDGLEVFKVDYFNDDNTKIKLVSELISLAPNKIILTEDFSNLEIAEYLEFLYDEKISVVK